MQAMIHLSLVQDQLSEAHQRLGLPTPETRPDYQRNLNMLSAERRDVLILQPQVQLPADFRELRKQCL